GVYADADADQDQDQDEEFEDSDDSEDSEPRSPVVMKMADTGDDQSAEPDYLDVDVVDEDSGALPGGPSAREADPPLVAVDDALKEGDATDQDEHDADQTHDDEYEYVEDSSGLEPDEDDESDLPVAPAASRRRRL